MTHLNKAGGVTVVGEYDQMLGAGRFTRPT